MPAKKPKKDEGPIRIGVGPFEHPGEGKGIVGALAKAKGITFDAAVDILAAHEGDFQAAMGNVREPFEFLPCSAQRDLTSPSRVFFSQVAQKEADAYLAKSANKFK